MKEREVFFSVIIPAYNSEKTIERTINSVLTQTYQNFECIIVNDGSIDRTEELILNFKDERIKYIKQDNLGVATARNNGVYTCKYEYVAFLDADDFWDNDFLEECYFAISKFSGIKLFCTRIRLLNNGICVKINANKLFPKVDNNTYIFNYYDIANIEPLISMSSVIIKKNAFLDINGFNRSSYSGEDHELYGKIGFKYDFCLINKVLSNYDVTNNGMNLRKSCFPPLVNFINDNIDYCHINKKNRMNLVKYKFILDYINGLIRRNEINEAYRTLLENKEIIKQNKLRFKYSIYFVLCILPFKLRKLIIKKIF